MTQESGDKADRAIAELKKLVGSKRSRRLTASQTDGTPSIVPQIPSSVDGNADKKDEVAVDDSEASNGTANKIETPEAVVEKPKPVVETPEPVVKTVEAVVKTPEPVVEQAKEVKEPSAVVKDKTNEILPRTTFEEKKPQAGTTSSIFDSTWWGVGSKAAGSKNAVTPTESLRKKIQWSNTETAVRQKRQKKQMVARITKMEADGYVFPELQRTAWIELAAQSFSENFVKKFKIIDYIRDGVPGPLRGLVWEIVYGVDYQWWLIDLYAVFVQRANECLKMTEQEYAKTRPEKTGVPDDGLGPWPAFHRIETAAYEALQSHVSQDTMAGWNKIIMADRDRTTFQAEVHNFQKSVPGSDPETAGADAFVNVLRAYAIFDPEVGYLQSLAPIVMPLLAHLAPAEAFAVLVEIMYRNDGRSMFIGDLLHVRPAVDTTLVALSMEDPELVQKLRNGGYYSTLKNTLQQWVLTGFGQQCDFKTICRIHDYMMTRKYNSSILSLSVAAISLYAPSLGTVESMDGFKTVMSSIMAEKPSDSLVQTMTEKLIKNLDKKLAVNQDTESAKKLRVQLTTGMVDNADIMFVVANELYPRFATYFQVRAIVKDIYDDNLKHLDSAVQHVKRQAEEDSVGLKSEVGRLRAVESQQSAEINQFNISIHDLEQTVNQLDIVQRTNEALIKDKAVAKNQIDELEASIGIIHSAHKEEMAAIEKNNADRIEKMSLLETEIAFMTEKLGEARANQLGTENSYKEYIATMQEELNNHSGLMDERNVKISELTEKEQQLTATVTRLSQESKAAADHAHALETEKARLIEERQKLVDELNRSQAAIADLESARADIRDLEAECETLESLSKTVIGHNENLEKQLTELKKKKADTTGLELKLEELEASNQSLLGRIGDLDKFSSQTTAERDSLAKQLSAQSSDHATAHRELQQRLDTAQAGHQSEITRMKNEHKAATDGMVSREEFEKVSFELGQARDQFAAFRNSLLSTAHSYKPE